MRILPTSLGVLGALVLGALWLAYDTYYFDTGVDPGVYGGVSPWDPAIGILSTERYFLLETDGSLGDAEQRALQSRYGISFIEHSRGSARRGAVLGSSSALSTRAVVLFALPCSPWRHKIG